MEDEGTCTHCCAKLSQYFEVNEGSIIVVTCTLYFDLKRL